MQPLKHIWCQPCSTSITKQRVFTWARLFIAVDKKFFSNSLQNINNDVFKDEILLISTGVTIRQGADFPLFFGWPDVLISFSITLSHSVPRHYTSCRGLVLGSVYLQPKLYQFAAWWLDDLNQAGIEPATFCAESEHEATTPSSRQSVVLE